jgi:hypothetical protein
VGAPAPYRAGSTLFGGWDAHRATGGSLALDVGSRPDEHSRRDRLNAGRRTRRSPPCHPAAACHATGGGMARLRRGRFVIVWFTPLNLEHGRQPMRPWQPLDGSTPFPILKPTPCDQYHACGSPFGVWWSTGTGFPVMEDPQTAALPVLVLRGAALGTAFWVVYLGVRAARSRVRFTVG